MRCLVNYNGTHIDGRRFESSLIAKSEKEQPGPRVFAMWDKELLPGLKEALLLMKEGDLWNVTIPAELAYGPRVLAARFLQMLFWSSPWKS
jgi:FKBP-type peptidyl-prolyl cis-trans isomerase